MAQLWLPFYDLGSKLPADAPIPITSYDLQLFSFLSAKIRASVKDRRIIPTYFYAQPPGQTTLTIRPDWLTFLADYAKSKGIQVAAPASPLNPCIEPHKPGTYSLMAAVNALYYKAYPSEFMKPSFTYSTSGSIQLDSLLGQMLLQSSWRCAYTPLSPTTKGPQREVAFYDISAPFGPGQTNKPIDQALVTVMLKAIFGNQTAGITGPSIGWGAIYGPSVIPAFGAQIVARGWSVDPNAVHPASGNTSAPSLIRALNYYYTMSMQFLGYTDMCATSQVQAQPTLANSLATNRKSLYFYPC